MERCCKSSPHGTSAQRHATGCGPLENIRDVTYGEDASQIRTGNGPQAMAALRNLAVGILKLDGYPSIAAACRYHARDATRTLATLRLIPP